MHRAPIACFSGTRGNNSGKWGRVSAEFTTVNSASTFNIQTNPITDEWIKVSGDSNWHTPSYGFGSTPRLIENHPGQMLYVSTTGSFNSNGQLVTSSSIQGTTP
jgi:hypothetical protein